MTKDEIKRFEQFLDEFDEKMKEHERFIEKIQKQQAQRVDSYNTGWNDAIEAVLKIVKFSGYVDQIKSLR